MTSCRRRLAWPVAAGLVLLVAAPTAATGQSWDDLVGLFQEWRVFEMPSFENGVPDYRPEAMARQQAELPDWKERLWSFDIDGWPVEQQIDWHLVRAEMNGLDFDLKIRRPWARDPAFYVMMYPAESDVPAHEGPVIHGWIDTWTYPFPLSDGDASQCREDNGFPRNKLSR